MCSSVDSSQISIKQSYCTIIKNDLEHYNMNTKTGYDSSSSEDDVCMEAIKEAADQDLLKSLLSKAECQKNNALHCVADGNDLNEDQYLTNGLTQSCRDFIAKKLVEKLDRDVVLEDVEIRNNSVKSVSKKPSGVKLLTSSNMILTEVIDDDDDELKKICRKKILPKFDEKANLLKCKQVALDSQTILTQHDLKFWVTRKPSQEFKYKKSDNGVLIQIA